MPKTIGVLGGLGPEATVDFFARLVHSTSAEKDQQHLHIVIDDNPQIPDRSDFIIGKGRDPTPELIQTAKNLEKAGADLISIPSATTHYFYPQITKSVTVTVLNLIGETLNYTLEKMPGIKAVGLLATDGCVRAGLYQNEFSKKGVKVIAPTQESQERAMRAIIDIKAGKEANEGELQQVLSELGDGGAEAVILGCTEFCFGFKGTPPVPAINSSQALAEATLREARN